MLRAGFSYRREPLERNEPLLLLLRELLLPLLLLRVAEVPDELLRLLDTEARFEALLLLLLR